MPSQSSRQKNASRVARDHATALLDDGAGIENPCDLLVAAAEHLRSEGLIDFHLCEYVNCVDPRDRDFPPRNRTCHGQIVLKDGQDEDGDEIRCPNCDRPVRPYSLGKVRHRLLRTTVSQTGAIAWMRAQLEGVSTEVRDIDESTFHVGEFGDLGVIVCVVDADGRPDSRFNTRDYAATNPICYVTINSRVPEGRFLTDEWVRRVTLVDLLVGVTDLRKCLTALAESSPPDSVGKADIPVYAKGNVLIQPKERPRSDRIFCVELSDGVVRIDGEIVVNPQAGPRLKLFRVLWRQFIKDLADGQSSDEFAALSMRQLLKSMKDEGHNYTDETSLRKVINNLQSDIETAVKRKLGKPIGREDIVQTCRMTSQSDTTGGYRLNPFSVAIRPLQTR